MKLATTSLLFLIITISCKKDKPAFYSPYIGTWELRGYAGTPEIILFPSAFAPGNGTLVKFTADTIYLFESRQLSSQFDYHIAKDTCIKCYDNPLLMDRFYYKDETEVTQDQWYTFVEIKNDTLSFYEYMLNGPYNNIRKYVRVANQ